MLNLPAQWHYTEPPKNSFSRVPHQRSQLLLFLSSSRKLLPMVARMWASSRARLCVSADTHSVAQPHTPLPSYRI